MGGGWAMSGLQVSLLQSVERMHCSKGELTNNYAMTVQAPPPSAAVGAVFRLAP